jgi:hypothetical protein
MIFAEGRPEVDSFGIGLGAGVGATAVGSGGTVSVGATVGIGVVVGAFVGDASSDAFSGGAALFWQAASRINARSAKLKNLLFMYVPLSWSNDR